jgi:AcrR family transcriptional regulator
MKAERDGTKARLLGEARDLYLEEGFARFSLREVARRAGVSAAAVYRHYDGKEGLFGEVCAAGLQVFYGYLVRAMAEATPQARLGAAGRQYLRFALEHPSDYRVLFMGGAADAPTAPPPGKPRTPEPTFQFLVDRVRECMHAGLLREGDADETAAIIWAQVHGLVSLRLTGQLARVGTDAQFARFYERAVDQLIAGLRA